MLRASVSLIDLSISGAAASTCRGACFHAHAVVDDDLVVHRAADQREDRRDGGQVEVEPGEREEADALRHVENERHDGADRERPLEAVPDVEQHREAGGSRRLRYPPMQARR